jgi:hypothetical protein
MRKLVAFALLLGLSFTQFANASVSSSEETSVMCKCDKCGKEDCHGSCEKKDAKSCKKGEKSCKKGKKSCCKKGKKSCSKKAAEKKIEEKVEENKEEIEAK